MDYKQPKTHPRVGTKKQVRSQVNSLSLHLVQKFPVRPVVGSKIPVLHAWNVDAKGSVIDSTWEPVGSIYFGILFPVSIVRRANASVLDDWESGWPLLRESWTEMVAEG
ncbi:MAG: hypothetical protein DMG31_12700 [Acidobacteria bacterium]|nr:MAG: hypothetical protein DMG31_12700 [Acidobacteriota bacterium]